MSSSGATSDRANFFSLYRAIYESALPSHLKATAGAMLTVGNADGTSIYPSVEYVAWLTTKSPKAARTDIGQLVELGVLQRLSPGKGGRAHTTRYRFNVDTLPTRASWRTNPEVDGSVSNEQTLPCTPETLPCTSLNPPVYVPKPSRVREGTIKLPTSYLPKDQQERVPRLRPEDLAEAWNELTTLPIPRCRELTASRRSKAKARLGERSLTNWRQVISHIERSRFLRGENDRSWRATFDWLLQPDTAVKVLEGKYDHSQAPTPTTKGARTMAAGARLQAALDAGAELDPFGTNAITRRLAEAKALRLGGWTAECDQAHGGQNGSACGNQHFHAAKVATTQAVSA